MANDDNNDNNDGGVTATDLDTGEVLDAEYIAPDAPDEPLNEYARQPSEDLIVTGSPINAVATPYECDNCGHNFVCAPEPEFCTNCGVNFTGIDRSAVTN